MKNTFSNISKWLLSLVMVGTALVSCEPIEGESDDPNGGGNGGGTTTGVIKITNVKTTYNTVAFTASAEGAKAIAYKAVAKGEELTAKEVFQNGQAQGVAEGDFLVKGLEADTEYTLLVAINGSKGYEGPASVDFKTEVNSGLPNSSEAAGIRVAELDQRKIAWEVTNGDGIDFSLTMAQPTILIENYLLEAAKEGINKENFIKSFMTQYGYLCKQTKGAGKAATYAYSEVYPTDVIFADARYSIFTVGCTGDIENPVMYDLTEVKVETLPMDRIGDPQIKVECSVRGITFLRHMLTPNADCKYWAKFFTKTSEIDEFLKHYDEKEGEGMGEKRLKEYIQHADPYILEQSGPWELRLDLGFDMQGVDYSRFGLAFDQNLVAADNYAVSIDQVAEPVNGPAAEFTLKIDSAGAGNFFVHTDFGANCRVVYTKIITPGAMDSKLQDSAEAVKIARELWNDGWAEWRAGEEGHERPDSTWSTTTLRYSEAHNTRMQLIMCGINYTGDLTWPVVSEPFETIGFKMTDREPSVEVSIAQISKTSALHHYAVEPDTKLCDERFIYSRTFQDDGAEGDYLKMDDESLREWFMKTAKGTWGGTDVPNANMWQLISNDEDHEDPYNYNVMWAAMEPATKYTTIYCTEFADGGISKLKRLNMETLKNTGGDNPEITTEVNNIRTYEQNGEKRFGADARYAINGDVKQYYVLFIGEKALKSYGYNVNDKEDLELGLYTRLTLESITVVDNFTNVGDFTMDEGKVWACAYGIGAGDAISKFSYVGFTSDGTIDDIVYIDCPELEEEWAPARPYTGKVSMIDEMMNSYRKPARSSYEKSTILPSKGLSPRFTAPVVEIEASELRAKGIPAFTMKELTLNALLKKKEL